MFEILHDGCTSIIDAFGDATNGRNHSSLRMLRRWQAAQLCWLLWVLLYMQVSKNFTIPE